MELKKSNDHIEMSEQESSDLFTKIIVCMENLFDIDNHYRTKLESMVNIPTTKESISLIIKIKNDMSKNQKMIDQLVNSASFLPQHLYDVVQIKRNENNHKNKDVL
jgi:hypothetical protein